MKTRVYYFSYPANLKFYAGNYKLNITFAPVKTIIYESNLDYLTAHSIQCIYDIRLVRTSETSGNENIFRLAAYSRDIILVGSRFSGVLCPSTSQQNRIHRERRTVQSYATQDNPGGNITDSIYRTCYGDVQGTDVAMEPFRSILLPDYGSILRFSQIKHIYRKKIQEKIWK